MKAQRSLIGMMAGLAMLAMGCSSGQLQLNSDPMSRYISGSNSMRPSAGSYLVASQEFDASSDGRYVVVAGTENGIVVLDALTGDVVQEFETGYRNILVNYSPCGELVAARDTKGVMRIWNIDSGKLVSERQM